MKITKELTANCEKIIFVCQNPNGWGMDITLEDSAKRCRRHTGKKPKSVHIYLVKEGFTEQTAMDSISINETNITFASESCILLQETKY